MFAAEWLAVAGVLVVCAIPKEIERISPRAGNAAREKDSRKRMTISKRKKQKTCRTSNAARNAQESEDKNSFLHRRSLQMIALQEKSGAATDF